METKYPANEHVWKTICRSGGEPTHIITTRSLTDRGTYFIYSVSASGSCRRLGKSPDPSDLERKYITQKN